MLKFSLVALLYFYMCAADNLQTSVPLLRSDSTTPHVSLKQARDRFSSYRFNVFVY